MHTVHHRSRPQAAHDADPLYATTAIERSIGDFKTRGTPMFVWLWLAARVRIACLKPELPSHLLWLRTSHLFDPQVYAAMTYHQYCWMNRHCAFAASTPTDADSDSGGDSVDSDGVSEDEDSDDEGDDSVAVEPVDDEAGDLEDAAPPPKLTGFDTHRKRRELTDLCCKAFGLAWRPHQHLGVDEAVRSHKHWGKMRIRFKATVHSGSLADCLNDCTSKYCMYFEEQHWTRKGPEDEDPHSLTSRLARAAACLVDPGAPCYVCILVIYIH